MIEVFRIEHKDNHGVIEALTPITEASRREDNEIRIRWSNSSESYKGLTLGIVVGFTPKMVKVASVFEKDTTSNIYPHDVAIVNSPEVTAILLKRKG